MKKILSVTLAILAFACLFSGCGKNAEPTMSELLIGDWYSYNGSPYRSFSENGTVTGTNNYSSFYTVENNKIIWDSASGNSVTVDFWTDGDILRISSNTGSYFTTRKYYCRSAEGVPAGTGMPQRGTSDESIVGTWYNGAEVFFTLNANGSVTDYVNAVGYCFSGEELILLTDADSTDEAASCKLEGDTLTIYYTDELTGKQAELVLTK